jgi:hypothetical protein
MTRLEQRGAAAVVIFIALVIADSRGRRERR